jgi:hypothetical protein
MYMQRTTSGAAGNGLYTTIKYLRGAVGIGLDTTIKYLRRTTSGAAGNGLGATINYLRCTTSGAAGNGLSQFWELLMCSFNTSAPYSIFFQRSSVAYKQNSTIKVRGLGSHCLRVCLRLELARCVLWPPHTRTEGRAPVGALNLLQKPLHYREGVQQKKSGFLPRSAFEFL